MRSTEEWQRLVGPRRWAEMNDPAHPCRDCGAPGFRVFAQNKDTGIDACVNHEERAVLELVFAQQDMGRPVFGPPGLPADRLKALRGAFGY